MVNPSLGTTEQHSVQSDVPLRPFPKVRQARCIGAAPKGRFGPNSSGNTATPAPDCKGLGIHSSGDVNIYWRPHRLWGVPTRETPTNNTAGAKELHGAHLAIMQNHPTKLCVSVCEATWHGFKELFLLLRLQAPVYPRKSWGRVHKPSVRG